MVVLVIVTSNASQVPVVRQCAMITLVHKRKMMTLILCLGGKSCSMSSGPLLFVAVVVYAFLLRKNQHNIVPR